MDKDYAHGLRFDKRRLRGTADIEGQGQTVTYTDPADPAIPILFRGRTLLQ